MDECVSVSKSMDTGVSVHGSERSQAYKCEQEHEHGHEYEQDKNYCTMIYKA